MAQSMLCLLGIELSGRDPEASDPNYIPPRDGALFIMLILLNDDAIVMNGT